MTTVTFDTECTTVNKGNPFTKSNICVCYSIKIDNGPIDCAYYDDLEFVRPLRYALENATLIVAFNAKYDLHVARRLGVMWNHRVRVWDCQIAEFILRGQKGSYPSLNEALARFNPEWKKSEKIEEYWAIGVQTTDIPPDELKKYNMLDVELTYKLYEAQQKVMTEKQRRLCMIMGLDLLVLEEMEWNGIKFDVEKCKVKAAETQKSLEEVSKELRQLLNAPDDINLDSGHQLSCLLYGGAFELTRVSNVDKLVYKSGPRKGQEYERNRYVSEVFHRQQLFNPIKGSETKLTSKVGETEYPIYATGEDVLKQLKKPTKTHKRIVELLLARAEQAKLLDTYYLALPELLEKMEWGDTLHGSYNQVVARTGRLSSSNPNQQNFSSDVDELIITRF